MHWNIHSIMDDKDEQILQILRENSKLSTHQISKKTRIPITTVHNRIKKLKKEGIIKKYSIIVDNKKIGKELAAYVLVMLDFSLLHSKNEGQHQILNKITKHHFVEEGAVVTGETDILIKVRCANIDELDDFLTQYMWTIEGVSKTKTLLILYEP